MTKKVAIIGAGPAGLTAAYLLGKAQQNVTVFDSRGARVYEKTYPVSSGYNLLNVNLKNAASGIYFVVLRDAYGTKLGAGKAFVKP